MNSNRSNGELFSRGATVLDKQILMLEDNLNQIKKMRYNIIKYESYTIENVNKSFIVTKSTIFYISVAFVLGLFLSLIIVATKNLYKKIS